MTSSGLSAVATAASGGTKREKQDQNGADNITETKVIKTTKPKVSSSKETGSSSFASKVRKDNTEKKKDKEEKEAAQEMSEPWWPPFSFDGRNALKSKMVLNLRNCQYDLFRDIALEELGWKIVDYRNRVIEYDNTVAK